MEVSFAFKIVVSSVALPLEHASSENARRRQIIFVYHFLFDLFHFGVVVPTGVSVCSSGVKFKPLNDLNVALVCLENVTHVFLRVLMQFQLLEPVGSDVRNGEVLADVAQTSNRAALPLGLVFTRVSLLLLLC